MLKTEIKREEIDERIMKAKIRIVNGNPYFAYLTLYLAIEEDTQNLMDPWAGMCITQDDIIFYRPDFVKEINDNQLIFCILHEVKHRAFLHLERSKGKHQLRWNIAIDLVVNTLLKNNGYEPPKGVILPTDKDTFTILGKTIKNISSKSAEELFDELPEMPDFPNQKIYVGFDSHIKGKGKKGQGDGSGNESGKNNNEGYGKDLSDSELNEIEQEWLNRVQTATIQAKQRGTLPKGIERFIEKLSEVEIPWYVLLQRYVKESIPVDQTWMKRSSKSLACGVYLPSVTKEKIDVVIAVDVSGSINQDEIDKFISEIISLAKTYKETISMKIFFHDTKIQTEYEIKEGNIQKILEMKFRGGGGTEFNGIVKEMENNKMYRNTKILIWLTDGMGNKVTRERNYPIIWILTKEGTDECIKHNTQDKIIRLKLK